MFRRKKKLTAWEWYQQGDVIIKPVGLSVTVRSKVRPDGVLATGEATGHAHRLAEHSDGLLYEAEDGRLYLHVRKGGATIEHEEHQPLTLPPGDYEVGRVREYDHFSEEMRWLSD